ncbi:MAG: DUF2804 domain-containing protein [Clostridiales bacterium]|nr:DUF2804 domain-containing protein [Clostridiales bacterium]
MQHEITRKIPLLDCGGNVAEPGYCKTSNYIYSRAAVKANPARIKEWDFYQISDARYTIQMTFADISLGGGVTFALFDRQTGERFDAAHIDLLTMGRYKMPQQDEEDHRLEMKKSGFHMVIDVLSGKRRLTFEGKCSKGKLTADIELTVPKNLEYLVMAVPFKEDKHFYLNKKMNCMNAKGYVKCGNRLMALDEDTAFGVLDWGRGVWPYKGSWYWSNGSTFLDGGKIFGFEIGWGFGVMDCFTENMLFYDGKAHKIGKITLEKDKTDYMKPWVFSSSDSRFEMTMTPEYDNFTSSRVLGVIGNVCHQVFGRWNGYAVLDDGTRLEIKNMIAFCEHSDNRW